MSSDPKKDELVARPVVPDSKTQELSTVQSLRNSQDNSENYSLDHAEFIARHHRTVDPEDNGQVGKQRRKSKKASIFLAVMAALSYILICGGVLLSTGLLTAVGVILGLTFIAASVMAYAVQKLILGLRKTDKEYRLFKEVLEGSRGARMITNASDTAIYTNAKFDALLRQFPDESKKNEDKPKGLESLSGFFSNNPKAFAHFTSLADTAYRGLTDSIELKTEHDGRKRWYSITAQPVSGWDGYIHWRIDEITRRLSADESLREEREKLIDFTDNAPVGFFSVNEDGRFIFVNGTLARWLGEDLSHMMREGRLHQYLLTPPKEGKDDVNPYDIIPGGGTKQIAEHKMTGPSGEKWLASITQTVVHLPGGGVRTRGVVRDLTSEKEMSQALKASEDKFQRFFDEAPLGIIIVSQDGMLEDCNAAFAQLLGYEAEEIEGKRLEILFNPESKDALMTALGKTEQGKQIPAPLEIPVLNKKGEEVIARMYARRFRGGEGIALHFIDLTQQKNLEAQFVQSQKMQAIGQLAGGIAHDFNNLLTAMTGFCDLLLLRHKPGDPSFGDIMQIKQNANRAANLVRQLLAFSRQQTLRTKLHDVSDILTEVSYLLRRLLGANIDLDLVHAPDLGLVKVDEVQIEQVLINLAVNARDAMEGSGSLTIATRHVSNQKTQSLFTDDMPKGDWVVIDVTDTGSGIEQETLKHILEPFFTTKDIGKGTGLGLATVYGIIRQTGGYLDVTTELGQGTTFSIYLPSSGEEDNKVKDSPDKTAQGKNTITPKARDLTGTARILLVEDEDAVRTFSSRALSNKGYEVLGAANAEAALDLLEQEDIMGIDLLVTDVIMPDMDGPTLAKKLRQDNPNLRIIFMSGYTEEKLKDQVDDNTTFLPKPFSLQKLAETVKDVLGASQGAES